MGISQAMDCDRELFEGSNGSAMLLVCNEKNLWLALWIFCD